MKKSIELSSLDNALLTIWAIVGGATFLWFAIDAGITLIYALRAQEILKAEIFYAILLLGKAGILGVLVYFGGYLISTLLTNFVQGVIKGIRERWS